MVCSDDCPVLLSHLHVEARPIPSCLTSLVALIAVVAVVDIAAYAPMLWIGLSFGVAVGAGKHRVVVRIRMAIAADAIGVAVVHVEPGVIECRVRPLDGVMAGGASGREVRSNMVRIIRVLIGRLMAPVTVRRQRLVVVIDMAVGTDARRHHVRTGEREGSLVVIEDRVRPFNGVVADLAGLRESRLHMGRIFGVVVVGLVAGDAGRIVQLVIVVDVAVAALSRRYRVRTGQRPAGLRVIKFAIVPVDGVMTSLTGHRQAGLDVIHWLFRVVIVLLMTSDASRLVELVIAIDVAIDTSARRNSVRPG